MVSKACRVSVLIPAFNSAATLPRAVMSALAQDLRDLEVVIVDDGSRDETAEVARQLASGDPRVRLITLARNGGKSVAMNAGIAIARGQWIAVLDADDWYAPDRLSTLLANADQYDVHLVADNQFFYDEAAAQVVRTAFPAREGDRVLDKAAFIAGSDPYAVFDFGMLKPVVRTDFIRSTGLSYQENALRFQDFLYLTEFFAFGGRGWLVARPTYYWCQAFGSVSRRWTETGGGKWRYNFLSAVSANDEVMRALHLAGESELAALLEQRMRAFQRLHRLQEISRLRANGAAPPRLMYKVLSSPTIWPMLLQRAARRAARYVPVAAREPSHQTPRPPW
jgi:succinoglycan biosynthesis protein ExoO